MWVLSRWLHENPDDLDLQCFVNMINLGAAGQELISDQSVYLHKHANTQMTVSLKITEVWSVA